MSVACRDIFTDRASITTRIFLSRRTATIKNQKRSHEGEKTSNDGGAPRGGGGGGGAGQGNRNSGVGGRATHATAQGGATTSETRAEQARFARELKDDGIEDAHLDAEDVIPVLLTSYFSIPALCPTWCLRINATWSRTSATSVLP